MCVYTVYTHIHTSIYQSVVRTFWKPLDKWGLMTSDLWPLLQPSHSPDLDLVLHTLTFALADAAALPVLPVAVDAVFVAGDRRTPDAAAHLTAVSVPPVGGNKRHAINILSITDHVTGYTGSPVQPALSSLLINNRSAALDSSFQVRASLTSKDRWKHVSRYLIITQDTFMLLASSFIKVSSFWAAVEARYTGSRCSNGSNGHLVLFYSAVYELHESR